MPHSAKPRSGRAAASKERDVKYLRGRSGSNQRRKKETRRAMPQVDKSDRIPTVQ